MINEPPSLNRDYNRDPNIKAFQRGGLLMMESRVYIMVFRFLGLGSGFKGIIQRLRGPCSLAGAFAGVVRE